MDKYPANKTAGSFNQDENEHSLTKNTQQEAERKYIMSYFPAGINKLYADFKFHTDKIRGFKNLKALFKTRLGYELNLDSPRSYNEKIVWKKIYDRNPLLAVTADKFEVRSYIKEILGNEEAGNILIPIYHVTDNPADIPFKNFPDEFVIKPNHGSKMHLIIRNHQKIDISEISKICREWLKVNYGIYQYEWAYRNIKRKIIVEQLLQEEDGSLPMDYKLYCFHGKCKFIRVSENRFGNDDISAYFDPDWNFIPVCNPGYPDAKEPFDKPENLGRIISLSEKLSEKFGSVRVDLFNCNSKIYFGELTHYDASGMGSYEPEAFDFELGSHWKAEKNYWLNI